MWLDDFADKARREVHRWLDILQGEGEADLRTSYRALGSRELQKYARDNAGFVDDLLRARSAAERERVLAVAPDALNRHALLLATCWEARMGLALLESVSNRSLEPSPGSASRDVCANAAAAAREYRSYAVAMWPFEN